MKNDTHILKELVNISQKVKSLKKMSFTNFQSWEDLQRWGLGETRNISGSINTKVYQDDERMEFKTFIPPRVYFPEHWHDFMEEVTVLEGYLNNLLNPSKIFSVGEKVFYGTNELHIPGNPSDVDTCLLRVIFKR